VGSSYAPVVSWPTLNPACCVLYYYTGKKANFVFCQPVGLFMGTAVGRIYEDQISNK